MKRVTGTGKAAWTFGLGFSLFLGGFSFIEPILAKGRVFCCRGGATPLWHASWKKGTDNGHKVVAVRETLECVGNYKIIIIVL
jgi:hypothetical protein